MFKEYLFISQILVAVFLILAILLQKKGGLSAGGLYFARRGIEKKIFAATIILAILFMVLALLNLILN